MWRKGFSESLFIFLSQTLQRRWETANWERQSYSFVGVEWRKTILLIKLREARKELPLDGDKVNGVQYYITTQREVVGSSQTASNAERRIR